MPNEQPINKISINYIEFEVSNIEQSKSFYGQLGWTFIDYGPEYCEFDSGNLKGGFSLTTVRNDHSHGALIVLYTHDLDQSFELIKKTEATIVHEIFEFPGGRRFEFYDLDGYKLAIWSDK